MRRLKNFQVEKGVSKIVAVDSWEIEKELWSLMIYLDDGRSVKLASVNVITPKDHTKASTDLSWQDILDPRIWIVVITGCGAIWFTSRKTKKLNEERDRKEKESVKDSRDAIDNLQRKLDALNKKFPQKN